MAHDQDAAPHAGVALMDSTPTARREDGIHDGRNGRLRVSTDPDYATGYALGSRLSAKGVDRPDVTLSLTDVDQLIAAVIGAAWELLEDAEGTPSDIAIDPQRWMALSEAYAQLRALRAGEPVNGASLARELLSARSSTAQVVPPC